MKKKSKSFKRMIILGDSNAYGMCAARSDNEWPQVIAALLRKFQIDPMEVINQAIPSNVISPSCPHYERTSKPSLIERYNEHCIALQPDLVVLAQSLNDMRLGMPIKDYLIDLEFIVSNIQDQTDALIILMGVYHQVYGHGFNHPVDYPWAARWDFETMKIYNNRIELLAKQLGVLFVDVQDVMQGADWLLHPDSCHMNDLGHVLIGNAVFQSLAVNCPQLSDLIFRTIDAESISVKNTGGTNASEDVIQAWNNHVKQFPDVLEGK